MSHLEPHGLVSSRLRNIVLCERAGDINARDNYDRCHNRSGARFIPTPRSGTCATCSPFKEAEDIDSAFWFTFAGFEQPRHHSDPHRDLDLASCGVMAVLEHERGTTYPDMAWEPKQVFGALAATCARARP